jgi:hypothetical protein
MGWVHGQAIAVEQRRTHPRARWSRTKACADLMREDFDMGRVQHREVIARHCMDTGVFTKQAAPSHRWIRRRTWWLYAGAEDVDAGVE